MKGTLVAIGIIGLLIFVSGGFDKEGKSPSVQRPPNREAPEYDCRKHALDKICEVPWKGSQVLYCYADPKHPRVVRLREECK